jgi:hypothetical protein
MALGTLPYRYRIVQHQRVGPPDGPTDELTVEVLDALSTVRGTGTLSVGGFEPAATVRATIEEFVQATLDADAGSRTALLAGVVADAPSKAWVTGDPAFVPDTIPLNGAGIVTWPNMPAAGTELPGARTRLDLSLATSARLVVNVIAPGSTNAVLAVQYSTDQTTWRYLDGGTGPQVPVNAAGVQISPWVDLEPAARGDVFIRIGGGGGNNTADPSFGIVTLQVR